MVFRGKIKVNDNDNNNNKNKNMSAGLRVFIEVSAGFQKDKYDI